MDQDGPKLSKPKLSGSRGLMGNADDLQPISSEVPDWTREEPTQFWDPGRKLLRTIRRYQYWQQRPGLISRFFCKILVLRHAFWSVVTGADIPLNCHIGGGLLIPHPNGIVIHPGAKIGVNCLIFQQVTIGIRDAHGIPEISGHVDIGAGAKILGAIKIGPHAKIGANAVVTRDVEGGMVAIDPRPTQSTGTD
jgi:serine O-acetyltransferase